MVSKSSSISIISIINRVVSKTIGETIGNISLDYR